MKKFINLKKVAALVMATTMALSIASCGGSKDKPTTPDTTGEVTTDQGGDKAEAEIEKPEMIKAYIDTVFGSQMEQSSWTTWVAKYKELTGIDIVFTKPVHNEFYQQLSLAYTTGDIPDVIEMGAVYYPTYANNGALWDMTSAWENSDLKASGTVDERYVDQLKINDTLFGFPMTRGGGTVTYVRQDWLDNLGMEAPTNYDEFVEMLRAFTEDDPDGNGQNDTFGITMPGLVSPETPYTIYQREFYQDAEPGFYQKADGTWVDGMTEPEMVEALQRMKDAFNAGYIDQEAVTNKTSTSRDKFYASQTGAFNYWAGQWNVTLQNNLTASNPDGIVVPIAPIAETKYIERPATAMVITTTASNPEGIFKYLIEYSHDSAEGELLFTRGVEGTHYEIAADGTYKALPDLENEKIDFQKAWYASELKITNFENPIEMDERMVNSLQLLSDNSIIWPVPVVNDVIAQEQADLTATRDLAIATAITDRNTTVEQAIADYAEKGKPQIDAILASLNN